MNESNLSVQLKVIVVPENKSENGEGDHFATPLAERMKDVAGKFDFGGINLFVDTERKFTELPVAQHKNEANRVFGAMRDNDSRLSFLYTPF